MQQIRNGFAGNYFIDENGTVRNILTGRILKQDKKHSYRLQTVTGQFVRVPLKRLYKLVFDNVYCKDEIISLENEQWKEIEGTEGNYFISNLGRVKSYMKYEAIIMQPTITAAGYERLQIKQEGLIINKFVHRLVAAAFLPAPQSIDYQLHHKDFNKRNNNAENLIWLSAAEHAKIHYEKDNSSHEERNTDTATAATEH